MYWTVGLLWFLKTTAVSNHPIPFLAWGLSDMFCLGIALVHVSVWRVSIAGDITGHHDKRICNKVIRYQVLGRTIWIWLREAYQLPWDVWPVSLFLAKKIVVKVNLGTEILEWFHRNLSYCSRCGIKAISNQYTHVGTFNILVLSIKDV